MTGTPSSAIARAYSIPFHTLIALENWGFGMQLFRQGETRSSSDFEVPKKGQQMGVGFWGAGRGWLTHHLELQDGVIANYQILTPSTWNASPQDPWGNPGPVRGGGAQHAAGREHGRSEEVQGHRYPAHLRSFDPCMPCTTHVHVGGADRVVTTDVNTCACGVDG